MPQPLNLFSMSEVEEKTRVNFRATSDGPKCLECGLYRKCATPKMTWTGQGQGGVLIVAEAPGEEEDSIGIQLKGQVGQFFRAKLKRFGWALEKSFWKMNAVSCRPWELNPETRKKNNRRPTTQELQWCRPHVEMALEELRPSAVLLLGGAAVESFFGRWFSRLEVSRWRGLWIPDHEHQCWLYPMFHPSYPMRDERNANLDACFDRDLQRMLRAMANGIDRPEPLPKPKIIQLTDYEQIISALRGMKEKAPEWFYIDYETTGLKPYQPGHKVLSAAFTSSIDQTCFAFPIHYRSMFSREETDSIVSEWKALLEHPEIGLAAHNAQFEHVWSRMMLGTWPTNWVWDTQLSAHVEDNRRKYTGLKFQAFVNYGVLPYDAHLNRYKEGKPFNRLEEVPLTDVLEYNGKDVYYGSMLMEDHWDRFDRESQRLYDAHQLELEGSVELAEVQIHGIPINEQYYIDKKAEIDGRLQQLKQEIIESEEAEKYENWAGRALTFGKDVSGKDLRELLFEVLGYKTEKTTNSGLYSVDEEVLMELDTPFTKKVLEYRGLLKVQSYPSQFLAAAFDGVMHPSIALNIPITYRSSAFDPNSQNIPKRDPEAKKITRSGVIPSKGNQIMESDFGGIEVGTSTCYNLDPNLIKYVTDPHSDMHRDAAIDLFLLEQVIRNWKDSKAKAIRHLGKNMWVFPQFYGSYYANCAKDLWKEAVVKALETPKGTPLDRHLQVHGIRTFEQFLEHCKEVEEKFWNERFPVYKAWKEEINALYRQQGFIENHFGFRYRGYMTRTECTNYQTQGTAFLILLWTLIRVSRWLREQKMRTRIMGQIHDSMIFDLCPAELNAVVQKVNEIGTQWTAKAFSWLTVPLVIEHEVAPVDRPWSEVEPFELPEAA